MSDSDSPANIDDDYNFSRETYYELIEKGKESLDLMIQVARESEHPRAFEVLANMLSNVAGLNDKLMDLNKKNKDIRQKIRTNDRPTGIENQQNIFVGSTTELQRFLTQQQNETIDITPPKE